MEALILILIFALYIFARLAFGSGETVSSKLLKRHPDGLKLIKNRQFDAAFCYFDNLVDLEPHNSIAFAMRAKCNLESGKLENTLIDAAKAISLDNTYFESYLIKGKALYQMGMLHEAILEFEKAVWYNRKNPEGYRWRGLVHCRLGYYIHGENDLKKAVELGDENAQHMLRQRGNVKIWGNQKH